MNRWLHSPLKRALDVVIAAVAIVVLSPVLVATAVAVRLRLGAPVLFRQRRSGRNGAPIEILKFRSMTDAVGPDGTPLADAERLTPFGRRLRATSLDELPQLWSVLRGDMSLVGPRPLPPIYDDRYTPEQRRRLLATPGITGRAQVQGRNSIDWPTKLAHDVWYVDNASLRVDLAILGRTLRSVVGRDGVSSDGHATMPEFLGDDQRAAGTPGHPGAVTNDLPTAGSSSEPVRFTADDRPEGIADVEIAVFEGEAVLFDVNASMVHHLNAVPAATWLCCDGETTVADLLDELIDTFQVSEPAEIETLTVAVHDSLARFASEGLLVGHQSAARLSMTPVPERAADGTEIFVAHDNP